MEPVLRILLQSRDLSSAAQHCFTTGHRAEELRRWGEQDRLAALQRGLALMADQPPAKMARLQVAPRMTWPQLQQSSNAFQNSYLSEGESDPWLSQSGCKPEVGIQIKEEVDPSPGYTVCRIFRVLLAVI